MPVEQDHRFILNCAKCEWEYGTDDFDDAEESRAKHQEHTGHRAEWDKKNLGIQAGQLTVWEVTCRECGDDWSFPNESDAENFYIDHGEYTDHEADAPPEKTTIGVDLPEEIDTRTLKDLILSLEQSYSEGVPLSLLTDDFAEKSADSDLIQTTLEKLKQKGEVYEPRAGHVRTT